MYALPRLIKSVSTMSDMSPCSNDVLEASSSDSDSDVSDVCFYELPKKKKVTKAAEQKATDDLITAIGAHDLRGVMSALLAGAKMHLAPYGWNGDDGGQVPDSAFSTAWTKVVSENDVLMMKSILGLSVMLDMSGISNPTVETSVLHDAVGQDGSIEMLQCLIDSDFFDINATTGMDYGGYTPAHLAINSDLTTEELVSKLAILLKAGADISIKDAYGTTVEQLIEEHALEGELKKSDVLIERCVGNKRVHSKPKSNSKSEAKRQRVK